MVIKDGNYKNVQATVKHVHKDFCFLLSPDFNTDSNIVIEKADNCQL